MRNGQKLRVLDLFSGIGGFSLGLERTGGFETVAFCEIDPFCRKVLAKHWPGVPIHEDVRELGPDEIGSIDVICGGFPCQDISSAGQKFGIAGERSGLWSEQLRLIRALRPRFAIVENVADLLARGMGAVLGDLAESRYDAEWHSIPASFVGLPQARERIWIIAYPDSGRCQGGEERDREGPILVLRPDDDRLALGQRRARDGRSWISRADDGVPNRVDRLRALGNAAAFKIPEIIGRAILEAKEMSDSAPTPEDSENGSN